MKITFLNTWFGKVEKPFRNFILEQAKTTDVFCFSEVSNGRPNLSFGDLTGVKEVGEEFKKITGQCASDSFKILKKLLPGYYCRFDSSCDFEAVPGEKFEMGLAVFVKEGIKILESKVVEINKNVADDPEGYERIMQVLLIEMKEKKIWINNFHGISKPGEKQDTPARIDQSKKIIDILKKQEGAKILGGDFNLDRNIESIKMFERFGMKNLIEEFNIKNTRSELNHSQYPNRDRQYYADFVFVSPEVQLVSFAVPNINISDHLPLFLEIE